MANTIGNSSSSSHNAALAGLRADLEKFRNKLADTTGCSSAKTPAGQAAIQEISCQIGDTQSQINNIELQQGGSTNSGSQGGSSNSGNPGAGNLIDVYA